ncbi:MAG: DUF1501 domain-containing protein [Pirellulales bacterium]|nr:DUF1501 domain-containing protein [Pirellulales bacterium]
MPLHLCSSVQTRDQAVIRRRDFLCGISAAAVAAGNVSWTDLITARAADLRKEGRACILLYMQGGPSQFETFSPLVGHANGGETKAIKTNVPGIEIAENLPELAKVADKFAIVRSMTSKEGSHPRASYLLHTGYLPTASIKHPAIGAITAAEIADPTSELPAYVRIGGRGTFATGGFLGVKFDPFDINNPTQPPQNSRPATEVARFQKRLGLLDSLQGEFAKTNPQEVKDHQELYSGAARMILSQDMQAFDLAREPANTRDSYGTGNFASGCLLARRLVEAGVPFIEVVSNGWDTHDDNFSRVKNQCGQIDKPIAALFNDLQARGLLEKTLVVWMGEFGRTPKINPRGGRDHYPRAFNVMLGGGGVRGGQVIGRVDASGAGVADRPVTVADFLRTICHSLGVDANKENMSSIGRPIKVVDGGEVVKELFA